MNKYPLRTLKTALIFTILIITLIFLFFYSGWNYSETVTETMRWKSGRFEMTSKTKLIGIILILSFPAYYIIKKRVFSRN